LTDAQVTLITERRLLAPYGLQGGNPGACGRNRLVRNGIASPLPGKGTFELKKGDILCLETPGGGGFGQAEKQPSADGDFTPAEE